MAQSKDFWFVPKTHGYGAYPANWKGWAAIVGFITATTAISIPLMIFPAIHQGGPLAFSVIAWLVLMLIVTVAFIELCRRKTDGAWQWRWTKKA